MTAPDVPFALGRLPTREDPRTLRLAAYLAADAPPPPTAVNWLTTGATWPLYRNDRIGDCTIVTCAHMTQSWSDAVGEPVVTAETDVIAAYSAVSGYDPRTGRPDNGAYDLDVMRHWRSVGVGGRRITAFARVDHTNLTEVRRALHRFGGLHVGIDLPRTAQAQIGGTWRETLGPAGRRGSWGGHAVHVGAYGRNGLTCTTWGAVQRMTWGFWRAYVDEVYAAVSTDFLDAAGMSPTGLDLPALLADLERVTS